MGKLILDACCNHMGNALIIKQMIARAEAAGVDYIKFQLYNSDNLNPGYPQYEQTRSRLRDAELSEKNVSDIIGLCGTLQITPVFTIFDKCRIEWLERNTKFALKIASPDLMNWDLIDDVMEAFPSKQVFISCGMHDRLQVVDTVERYMSRKNIVWMYCVSMYPTPYDCVDFQEMQNYSGFSDHTIGLDAIMTAIDMHPRLEYFEKHFTLSKELPIKDKDWSVEPGELRELMAIVKYKDAINNYKKRWRMDNAL